MTSAILLLLTVIAQIAPTLGASASVTAIINTLVELVPIIAKELADAQPLVMNIINALRNNGQITAEQLADLDALEAKADAEFEAAVAMPDSDGMAQ